VQQAQSIYASRADGSTIGSVRKAITGADQNKLLNHQSKIIKARNQPKANHFLQGGYGRCKIVDNNANSPSMKTNLYQQLDKLLVK
jgi:hypothetical protein